jgi:hypothetical protein
MKTTLWLAIGLAVLAATPARAAQELAAPATYVDENTPDPPPLKLSGVEGTVLGLGGDAMPRVSVSLFTEVGHTLLTTVITDKDGKFRFSKVEKGLYRVVAKIQGLCPANIPVKVEAGFLAHHHLEITMQPKDIDTCSYGLAKK